MHWGHSINNGVWCTFPRFWLPIAWDEIRILAGKLKKQRTRMVKQCSLWRQICSDCLVLRLYTCCWPLGWMKPMTCKCYSHESARVCPSSWQSFPWFSLGKSTWRLPPYRHTGLSASLAFIKEILFSVSGWYWEGWDRCLLGELSQGKKSWKKMRIFNIKSHEQCTFMNICPVSLTIYM